MKKRDNGFEGMADGWKSGIADNEADRVVTGIDKWTLAATDKIANASKGLPVRAIFVSVMVVAFFALSAIVVLLDGSGLSCG